MKPPLLPIFSAAVIAVTLAMSAQTNSPATGPAEAPTNEMAQAEILADHLRTDVDKITNHVIITVLEGNVRIDHPQVKVTCVWLMALQPESGGRFTNVVAETNVVIDAIDENGKPIHATGDKAVYTYRALGDGGGSERVELTGSYAIVETENFTNRAPKIILTKVNGKTRLEIDDPHIKFLVPSTRTNTNPRANTNAPPRPRTNAPTL